MHLEAGHANPFSNSWIVDTLLRGTKRVLGAAQKQKLPITPQILQMRPSLQKVSLWKFAGQRQYNTVSACFMFLFLAYLTLRCVRHKLSSFPCVCPSPPLMGLFSLFPGLGVGSPSQVTCLIRNCCNF